METEPDQMNLRAPRGMTQISGGVKKTELPVGANGWKV
jgi:hypothetical protein